MNHSETKVSFKNILLFIIPSLIGITLFMIPIPLKDGVTIPIAIFSGFLQKVLGDSIPAIMTFIILLTIFGSIVIKVFKPNFLMKYPFLIALFDVSPIWFLIRLLGAIFAIMTFYKIGPEWVYADSTGGTLLFDLLPILFSVFLFAGMFLPLLLNFGLLEFFGALLTKVMRPLFKLPGRSSIDCLASWIGDGTIGVLLTSKQYEQGFYTKKEAAIVGTTFSVVSITFSLVVISEVGLADYFVPFYLTVTFAGIVAAIITPRIPPLSRKENSYFNGKEASKNPDEIPAGYTSVGYGFKKALEQAEKNKHITAVIQDGVKNVLDMWMGVAPIVMAMGTLALIIAEQTPIFQWLGAPFVPVLELMQVPEAQQASQTIIVGFADMFLPAIIGSGIESELTRFVIACLSVSQLIYMSEVGGLLLGSKIPVNMKDLFFIFLIRTVITLPIIVLIAHWIF
ncbi:nucleoside recognition membrane protein YjiH [Oikeobacillus pervagus]|uniref:Nucleoside recognition membrane protein YjiH n=1 Tax=Oikeobacillus pervagus TaxID=1325931 RepID=A0AAJ1T3N3_9BACI|nr:YjiH family protein [Oikeobacillus pervagus]MDQ0215319.1 nucleoside recognition membrane protein YjiH [Oikeobacillus pervagus]